LRRAARQAVVPNRLLVGTTLKVRLCGDLLESFSGLREEKDAREVKRESTK